MLFSFPTFAASGSLSGKIALLDSDSQFKDSEVVIYLPSIPQKKEIQKNIETPSQTHTIKQIAKNFQPSLNVVVVGEKVNFLNEDEISHNVFSVSSAKQFDLGQAFKGQSATVDFNQSGIVEVFCNIHPEMMATILVLPNAHYSINKINDTYKIENIPIGEHEVYIWGRGATAQSKKIVIEKDKTSQIDWTLAFKEYSKTHLNKYGKPYNTRQKKSYE